MAELSISKEEALSEAYNRGMLPPDMKSAYEEAMNRGLFSNSKNLTKQTKDSTQNLQTSNLNADSGTSKPLIGNAEDFQVTGSNAPPIKLDNEGLGYDKAQRTPLENIGRGAMVGLERTLQGPNQMIANGLSKLGVISDEAAKLYSQKAQARLDYYDKGNLGQSTMASIGEFGGGIAPYFMGGAALKGVPMIGEALGGSNAGAGILNRFGMGAAGGATIGASQFVPENGSRGDNAFIGGILGGAGNALLPPIIEGGSKLIGKGVDSAKNILSYFTGKPESSIANNILAGMNGKALEAIPPQDAQQAIQKTLDTMDAGQRLGLQLTPAQASGNSINSIIAARQGTLGSTDTSALMLSNFNNKQAEAQQNAISKLFDRISPNSDIANVEARTAARQAINDSKASLRQKAEPFYTAAESQTIPPEVHQDLLKNTNISSALARVKNDPIYRDELAGFKDNQVKVLDLVKRELDDKISSAEPNKARILMGAKQKLVDTLDAVSPEYKTARGIYSEELPAIKALETGDVGRIANLNDAGLQRVSKIIFDPAETDIKTLSRIKDQISKQNPELWSQLVRNSMESSLDASRMASAGKPGSAFYNATMATDRQFNQYLKSLEDIPGAQQNFIDMRAAFKNLINNESVKGAAGKAKSSLDVPREPIQAMLKIAKAMTGGNYDKAAVEFITSDKWVPYVKQIKNIKNPQTKAYGYANLLSKIAAQQATVDRSNP